MSGKMKLLKAVMKVYGNMTVAEFNHMFEGKTEEEIQRHVILILAESEQFGGVVNESRLQ